MNSLNVDGINIKRETLNGFQVDTLHVRSNEFVIQSKKDIGTYITVHLDAPIHELPLVVLPRLNASRFI